MRRVVAAAIVVAAFVAGAAAVWVFRGQHGHETPMPVAHVAAVKPSMFPNTPALRIEVSQHSAPINAVSIDHDSRFMVTGSDDKTVRVWELPNAAHRDLQQLEVLHPPIGAGDVGRVYTAAISADGSQIAVGGWMSPTSDTERIYIFDRLTGRIAKVVPTPYGSAHRLAFSPDGAYLAMSFEASLHIFRTTDWSEVGGDTNFKDDVFGIVFTSQDRLIAVDADGSVRIYDPVSKTIVQSLQVQGGVIPWNIAISPDNTKVAIGHIESREITVFDLVDGKSLANPRVLQAPGYTPGNGIERDDDNLCHVAWSADGHYLFAAGGYRISGDTNGIVRWDMTSDKPGLGTKGTGAHNAIFGLAAYGPSGVALVSADPLIEGYDANGGTVFSQGSTLRDMRIFLDDSDEQAFRVSNNATVVDIPQKTYPSALRVDFSRDSVAPAAGPDQNLAGPTLATRSFDVSNWRNSRAPVFEKAGQTKPLQIQRNDVVRSLAIAPNGKWFVLGTTWTLELYDENGNPLYESDAPSSSWRVVVTPDSRMIVAADGDGIIRWYAVKQGPGRKVGLEQLLSLYVNEPDHRWIAWTPNGFYDASVGGEDLIGWHINRGDQAALFYSASRFRDLFYRPDLIQKVLKTREVPPAPDSTALLERLPPIVHVLGIEPGEDGKAVVKYIVESPNNDPLTDVSVMVDGARVNPPGSRAISENDVVQTTTFAVPSGANPRELKVSAATKHAGYGDARSLPIAPNLLPNAGALKGRLFALVVGVAKYQDRSIPTALYSDLDANAVAQALRAQKGVRYKDVSVVVLTNAQATREAIEEALQDLRIKPSGDDVSLLFFSGHGYKWQDPMSGKQTPDYYFVTSDAKYSNQRIASTALPYEMLEGYVTKALGKKLIFLDTCYSGRVGDNDDTAGLTNLLSRSEGGAMVWSSSTGNQESYPVPSLKHGAFTAALLQALTGKADSYVYAPDRSITQHALTFWLDNTVPRLSFNHQNPTESDLGMSSQAFPILSAVKL